jgi:putative DNA primase/helicase
VAKSEQPAAVVVPVLDQPPATDVRLPAPLELQHFPQWVLWKWTRVNGKWTKPPYQVNGRKASHSNLATWTTYANACAHEDGYDGLGFVLTPADPFAVLDLDHCRDPLSGDVKPWAQKVIDRFDTYTEASPTGTGVHILLRGVVPSGAGRKKKYEDGAIEIYGQLRYITVTGRRL